MHKLEEAAGKTGERRVLDGRLGLGHCQGYIVKSGAQTITYLDIGCIVITIYSKASAEQYIRSLCEIAVGACGLSDFDWPYATYAKAAGADSRDGKCADQIYTAKV